MYPLFVIIEQYKYTVTFSRCSCFHHSYEYWHSHRACVIRCPANGLFSEIIEQSSFAAINYLPSYSLDFAKHSLLRHTLVPLHHGTATMIMIGKHRPIMTSIMLRASILFCFTLEWLLVSKQAFFSCCSQVLVRLAGLIYWLDVKSLVLHQLVGKKLQGYVRTKGVTGQPQIL